MKKGRHNSTRRSVTSRRNKKRRHRIEVSAGGLVYKKKGGKYYFGMLKDSFGKWTFPKGHVRKGESYAKAAAREIEEELGLKKPNPVKKLGKIDIWFRDRFVFKGKLVHKFIHYFLFESPEDTRLFAPKQKKKGEKIKAVAWVPAKNVLKRSAYADMKPIIRKAFKHIGIK